MNGVTIIEEHFCREAELGGLIAAGIFITLMIGGALLLYRSLYNDSLDKKLKTAAIICSIALVAMFVVCWTVIINKFNTTHLEYTVIVDDSVSFNDFHAKYEIISTNGNEYRVAEK